MVWAQTILVPRIATRFLVLTKRSAASGDENGPKRIDRRMRSRFYSETLIGDFNILLISQYFDKWSTMRQYFLLSLTNKLCYFSFSWHLATQ